MEGSPLDRYGLRFNPFSEDGSAERELPELHEVLVDFKEEVGVVEEAITSLKLPVVIFVTHWGGGKTKLLHFLERHFRRKSPNVLTVYVSIPPVKGPMDFPGVIFWNLRENIPSELKAVILPKLKEFEEKFAQLPRPQAEQVAKRFEANLGRSLKDDERKTLVEVLSADVVSFTDVLVDFFDEVLSLVVNVDRFLLLVDQVENYLPAFEEKNVDVLNLLHVALRELSQRLSEKKNGVVVFAMSDRAYQVFRSIEEESPFMSRWRGTKAFQYIKGILSTDLVEELIVKYCEIARGKSVDEVNTLSSSDIDQLLSEGSIPFSSGAIYLTWALPQGFPRDVMKLAYQALDRVEKGQSESVDEACIMRTSYAQENYLESNLQSLKSYIHTACGCSLEGANSLIEETLENYNISVENAAKLLSPEDAQKGQEYLKILIDKELFIPRDDETISLSPSLVQGIYRVPQEIAALKVAPPLPSTLPIRQIKAGFTALLRSHFSHFPISVVQEASERPWNVISLEDMDVAWSVLLYYFGSEEERECSSHVDEARRLMSSKGCNLLLGFGPMDKEKFTELIQMREGIFDFFDSPVSVELTDQCLYLALTTEDLIDLSRESTLSVDQRNRLAESMGMIPLQEKVESMLVSLLERSDRVMPVYLKPRFFEYLLEIVEGRRIPERHAKEINYSIEKLGSSVERFSRECSDFEIKLLETVPSEWTDFRAILKSLYPKLKRFSGFQKASLIEYLKILHWRGYVDLQEREKEIRYRASNLRDVVNSLRDEVKGIEALGSAIQVPLPPIPRISCQNKREIFARKKQIEETSSMVRDAALLKLREILSSSKLKEVLRFYEMVSSLAQVKKLREKFGPKHKRNFTRLSKCLDSINILERDIGDPNKSLWQIKDDFLQTQKEIEELRTILKPAIDLLEKIEK